MTISFKIILNLLLANPDSKGKGEVITIQAVEALMVERG
jgi:hypothetical protein